MTGQWLHFLPQLYTLWWLACGLLTCVWGVTQATPSPALDTSTDGPAASAATSVYNITTLSPKALYSRANLAEGYAVVVLQRDEHIAIQSPLFGGSSTAPGKFAIKGSEELVPWDVSGPGEAPVFDLTSVNSKSVLELASGMFAIVLAAVGHAYLAVTACQFQALYLPWCFNDLDDSTIMMMIMNNLVLLAEVARRTAPHALLSTSFTVPWLPGGGSPSAHTTPGLRSKHAIACLCAGGHTLLSDLELRVQKLSLVPDGSRPSTTSYEVTAQAASFARLRAPVGFSVQRGACLALLRVRVVLSSCAALALLVEDACSAWAYAPDIKASHARIRQPGQYADAAAATEVEACSTASLSGMACSRSCPT